MELLYQLAVVAEIIFVNLLCTHSCSTKTAPLWKVVAVQVCFTAFIVAGGLFLVSHLPFYGNGNGLFVFIGFLYLLPIHRLYGDSLLRNLIVVCFVWVYTLTVFSVSVQAAYLLSFLPFTLTVLACQTALFSLTLFPFLTLLRRKFLAILENVDKTTYRKLIKTNFLGFFLVFFMHISYIFPHIHLLRVAAITFLFFEVVTGYLLIHNVIENVHTLKHLKEAVSTDALTGLKNRKTFQDETRKLIERGVHFSVIFIDLNRFKQINDTYGHQAGDDYLNGFCRHALSRLGGHGSLYRLSGDEFTCVMTSGSPEEFAASISAPAPAGTITNVPFLGASTGVAVFPAEADTLDLLVSIADYKMYQHKKTQTPLHADNGAGVPSL